MSASDVIARVFDRCDELGGEAHLARWADMPVARLREIRETSRMTSSEFERISRALAVDPSSMYRGEERTPLRSTARFRAAFETRQPSVSDVRLLALAAEVARVLSALRQATGRPTPLSAAREVRPLPAELGEQAGRQGYELGAAARKALDVSKGPIPNVTALLESLGVHVARVRFSSSHIDAASIWDADAAPVILLNEASPTAHLVGAVRATLAHELCHLMHDANVETDATTSVSFDDTEGHAYGTAVEKRARGFAPSFLAPASALRAWKASLTPRAVQEDPRQLTTALAEHWGLSFEGAVWHAKNARLIKVGEANELLSGPKPRRLNFASFERPANTDATPPEHVAPIWRGLAAREVQAAVAAGVISDGRARELLTWG